MLNNLPRITYALLAVFLAVTVARGQSDTTILLILSSIVMFACCWTSAIHLLGGAAAARFVGIAVVVGWTAEELGATYGWFFGSYTYTDVLGPTLGHVPVIIPLMWFALTYTAYVLSNLMVWQTPVDDPRPLLQGLTMSFLAAALVTAYDLGADPYMVFVLEAWIMAKKDGWWFGETLQGFVGWMFVSFVIVMGFRFSVYNKPPVAPLPVQRKHTIVPLVVYAGSMVFQSIYGHPVETRTIALFAMGIPLVTALCGLSRWQAPASRAAA